MKVRCVARFVLPVVLIVAVVAACQPVKPEPGPAPGRNVAYYLWRDFSGPGVTPGTSFFRSQLPGTHLTQNGLGTYTQRYVGNAPVLETINGPFFLGIPFNGFFTPLFRLGDFTSARLEVAPGSSGAGLGLLFDVNGDGQVLAFDAAGQSTGFGGDELARTGATQNQLVVNDTRVLVLEPNAGLCNLTATSPTIGDLKSGVCPGISANTMVSLIVYSDAFGDQLTTITSLQLNGIELL
jgi:hypothetical protein